MVNPWANLPGTAVVVSEDRPYIDAFNSRHLDAHHQLQEHHPLFGFPLLPEPFLGDVCRAPIVILQQNPRVQVTETKRTKKRLRAPIVKTATDFDNERMRDYLSNPCERSCHVTVLANEWWEKVTRALWDACKERGVTSSDFEQSICSIEFLPYWSQNFHSSAAMLRLPSQDFTFFLVREAIHRDAIFLILRGAAAWYAAVPELLQAHTVERKTNMGRIQPRLTAGQLAGSSDFGLLVDRIVRHRSPAAPSAVRSTSE